jgi:hypothetical protein
MKESIRVRLPIAASLIVTLTAAVVGCQHRTVSDPGSAVTVAVAASPEETARVMIEALKSGDVDAFLAHTDLHGIYMQFPEPMRRTFSFQYFKSLVEKAKAKVGDAELNEFKNLSYEILGVEERDGQHVVQFKTQGEPGKKWKLFEAYFHRVDGEWKLSGRGLRRIRTPEYP